MAKKHDMNMIFAWAKENGLRGFDHLDPIQREKNRMFAIKRANQQQRNEKDYEHKKH